MLQAVPRGATGGSSSWSSSLLSAGKGTAHTIAAAKSKGYLSAEILLELKELKGFM